MKIAGIAETEKGIQVAIVDWINTLPGFRIWRQNTGKVVREHKGRKRLIQFGIAGQADLTGIGPNGIRVEIEVKSATGELSEKQFFWLEDIRRAGGIAFHCFSLEMCIVKMRDEFKSRDWTWNSRWEL